jgi:hypothetical protein
MKRIALLVVSTLFLTFVPMAHAETVGTLDGAFSYPGYVNQQFNGSLCAAPNVCEVIPGYQNFPSRQNIEQGVTALENWLPTHPDSLVLGTSEGAQVAYQYGRENPTSTQQFVVSGNPERKYGGIFYSMSGPTPTGGEITDVALQYDFFADFPNNPSSQYYWLAVTNALVGGIWTHIVGYNTVNLSSPNNVVWQEDNITYVLVPNQPTLSVPQTWIEDAYIRPTGPVIYGQTPTVQEASPLAQSNSPEPQALSTTTSVPPTTQMAALSSPAPSATPKPKHKQKTDTKTSTSASTSKSASTSSGTESTTATKKVKKDRELKVKSVK